MSTLTPSFVQSGPLFDVLSAVASATDDQLKQSDENKHTLLHGACARVDGLPIVSLLLKWGLDGNAKDASGRTPLLVAKGVLVHNNNYNGIFYNYSPGKWIPPSSACSSAVPFLENGTIPPIDYIPPIPFSKHVFISAVRRDVIPILKSLFTESTQSEKKWVKDNGNVVLGKAIESNNFDVFKHLLYVWDVPFDQSSKEAEVLLMEAVRGGKDKCVEGLLSVGVAAPSSGALTAAVESGSIATARVIIDSSGFSVTPELATALCVTATESGKKDIAMLLAQNGGITAASGLPALQAAIDKNDVDLTRVFFNSVGIILSPEKATALCVTATQSDKKDIAMLLAQKGGITAASGLPALQAAIGKGDVDLTRVLLDTIKVPPGLDQVKAATAAGSTAVTGAILSNSQLSLDPDDAAALCVSATKSGGKDLALLVAQKGGITATAGVAALHAAIEKGDKDLAKYLVETVKVHIKAKHDGKTALEVASEHKRTAISAYLQEAVLKQPLAVPAAVPRPTPAAPAPAQPSTPTPKDKKPADKLAPGPSTPAGPATAPSKPTPQAPQAPLALNDKGKALLGDWAVAAQLDLMARVRSVCTEETSSPSVPSTLPDLPSITSLVSDHLQALATLAGTPWTAEVATAAQKSQSLAQAMADLSALRDELSSDKPGKSLRARISEVPTHDSNEVQALRDSLLAQIQTARKFDPNIPRSALALDKKPFARGAFSKAFKGTYHEAPIVAKVFKTDGMTAEDLKSRVAKEASAMAKCQHPNIVRSYGVCADFEDEDDDPFVALVLEPYPEGTASDLLKKRGGPLTGPEAALILEGAAHGLDELHRQGIIHKDLKTDNILIERDSEDGSLHGIIADFGLSVDLAFSSAQYNLGGGTWNYQAPEQLKPYDSSGKDLRITSKVDMYAFGVVSWALATNKEPWEGQTPMGIAQLVVDLNQRPTFPTAPDPAWQTIQALALRCFETDPEKRPTAQEAAKELSKLH